MHRFVVARAVAYSSGRLALQRTAVAYLGLLVFAAALMGGNGLEPRTITAFARQYPAGALGLAAAWSVFCLPALSLLLTHSSTQLLRTFPMPRGQLLTTLLVGAWLFNLPWFALWAVGEGFLPALLATFSVMNVELLWLGCARTWRLLPGGALGLWMLLGYPPGWAAEPTSVAGLLARALPLGSLWVAVALGLHAVWFQPRRGGALLWSLVATKLGTLSPRTPAWIQLALAYQRVLLRGHAARVGRGVGFFSVGTWIGQAALNNAQGVAGASLCRAVWLLAAVLTTATLVPAVMQTEHAASWLLQVTGARLWARRLAATFGALVSVFALSLAFASVAHAAENATASAGGVHFPWQSLMGCCLLTVAVLRRTLVRGPAGVRFALLGVLGVCATAVTLAYADGDSSALLFLGGSLVFGAALGRAVAPKLRARLSSNTTGERCGRTMQQMSDAMLELCNVHKKFGPKRVLAGVSLACRRGELCAVVGTNGAGKTTLLGLASGQSDPDSGEVAVLGRSLRNGAPEPRSHLGFVPDQSDAFNELCVGEFLALVRALKHAAPDEQLERDWDVEALRARRLGELSFGQRKRVHLVAALAGAPEVLVMDEPSNGLDPAASEQLTALLHTYAARGGCVLFSTNDAVFRTATGARAYRLEAGLLAPV